MSIKVSLIISVYEDVEAEVIFCNCAGLPDPRQRAEPDSLPRIGEQICAHDSPANVCHLLRLDRVAGDAVSRRVEHLSIAIADLYDVVNRKAEAVIKLIMTISGVAATGEPRPLLLAAHRS